MAQKIAELSAEVTAETGDFEKGMSNVEKAIAGTRTTIGGLDKDISVMGRNMGSANDALHALGVSLPITPMAALGSAVGFVGGQIQDTVQKTLAWADSMDKLSRNTGTSVEEASRMAVILGDFGIEAQQTEMAIKSLAANGIALNSSTLADLAKQYQALPPGVDRLNFATKNFGRAAQDMTEILSKTPAELDALGKAADRSGKIMSGAAVEGAQAFKLQLAQLNDELDGLKISAGGPLISVLTKDLQTFRDVEGALSLVNIAVQERLGIISHEQAVARADAAVNGDLFAAYRESTTAAEQSAAAIDAHAEALNADWEESKRGAEGQSELGGKIALTGKAMKAAGREAGGFRDLLAGVWDTGALLAAGLSGTIAQAQETYKSVIAETTPEIAKLTAEIEKYQQSQGKAYTFTQDATTSANEYELATLKAAAAQQTLAEYTDDDALKLAQLKVNADNAQESVVKLGEGLGFSKDYTVDHTKALSEDNAAMADLIAKQDAAKKAFDEATASFLLQQAALDNPEVALQVAHSLGIISDADYDLAKSVQQATKDWDLNKNGMIDVGVEADGLTGVITGLKTGVERAAGVVPPLTENIGALGGQSDYAAGRLHALNQGINELHDKTVNIQVNVNMTQYGSEDFGGWTPPAGSPAGPPAGPPSITPEPGIVPGMSGPSRTSSPGGVTIVQNIYNPPPVTDATLLQTARAQTGGW